MGSCIPSIYSQSIVSLWISAQAAKTGLYLLLLQRIAGCQTMQLKPSSGENLLRYFTC